MKTIEQKAKAYDEAIDKLQSLITNANKQGHIIIRIEDLENSFPELKESEDDRIRKAILGLVMQSSEILGNQNQSNMIAWLEKQSKHLENYDEAEKEKAEFVGDGFIKCHADFLDFKEGNTYWLEYIGDDKYNVRSDNLLGQTYHITPGQLYTVFKKLTWIGKQGEEPQGKSALEAAKEEKVDNQNCANTTNNPESKFYEENWITIDNDNPCQVINIDSRGNYIVQYCNDEETHVLSKKFCESYYHLWTIQDAKEGDVLIGNIDGDDYILIFKEIKDGWIETYGHYYGCVDRFYVQSQLFCRDYKGTFYPANKELREFLISKINESEYEWDANKKELKKIEDEPENYKQQLMSEITDLVEDYISQKPTWTEEDEKKLSDISSILRGREGCYYNSPILIDWLKSLKEKIGG